RNVDPLPSSPTDSRVSGGLKISIGISRAEVRTELATQGRQLVYEVENGSLDGAQSLAAIAGPGALLCGPETWRATRRVFRFQERAGGQWGRCYLVEGALSRAERIRERRHEGIVLYGRDLPRKTLRDTFREMLLAKQSRTLVISGETG